MKVGRGSWRCRQSKIPVISRSLSPWPGGGTLTSATSVFSSKPACCRKHCFFTSHRDWQLTPSPRASSVVLAEAGVAEAETMPTEASSNRCHLSVPQTPPQLNFLCHCIQAGVSSPLCSCVCVCACVCMCAHLCAYVCLHVCYNHHSAAKLSWSPGSYCFHRHWAAHVLPQVLITMSLSNILISFQEY